MKKNLAMVLALALCLTASGALADGQFRVGLECNYAPFNWTQTDDANGAVPIDGGGGYAGGYDVEMAKKVAEGAGQGIGDRKDRMGRSDSRAQRWLDRRGDRRHVAHRGAQSQCGLHRCVLQK